MTDAKDNVGEYRFIGLSSVDAASLKEYLEHGDRASEIKVSIVSERRNRRGLPAPIPPEVIVVFLAFGKGVATGAGVAVGKWVVERVREYMSAKKQSVTLKANGVDVPIDTVVCEECKK